MRVTFLCPPFDLTGGQRVIAIHAEGLRARGHDVVVVAQPWMRTPAREYARALLGRRAWPRRPRVDDTHLARSSVEVRVVERYRPIVESDVPDADVVVATWWETAEWVAKLSPRKGAHAYFVQDHEVFARVPGSRESAAERVEATLGAPMQKIVVAPWLADLARDRYGDPHALVVPNAVDHELFRALPRGKAVVPTVGVLYALSPRKNVGMALEAVRLARRTVPGLRLIAFGRDEPSPEVPLPEGTEYHHRPEQGRIRALYSACDAWLFCSKTEGFGLPILESMACRTPVIATRAAAAPELLSDGGGILLDAIDAAEMARAIERVAVMPEVEWIALSERAHARAQRYTWAESTRLFEEALHRTVERQRQGELA